MAELFLKNESDNPYFSFLKDEKNDKLELSFEEFLKKVEKEYPGLSSRTGRIKQSDISQTTKKNFAYEENLLHIKKPKVTEDINIDMSDMGGF